jgi:hypothetical protein
MEEIAKKFEGNAAARLAALRQSHEELREKNMVLEAQHARSVAENRAVVDALRADVTSLRAHLEGAALQAVEGLGGPTRPPPPVAGERYAPVPHGSFLHAITTMRDGIIKGG